jgi:hypothetical protein
MTFQGLALTWLAPAGLGAALAVVVFYAVRWRLPRQIVGTTSLWLAATGRGGRSGTLGRLENPLSLAMQLTLVGAIALAVGQPRLSCQSAPGMAVALVLDRSPSMATQERIEPRIETARRKALNRLSAAAASDRVGLVLAGAEPELAVPLGADPALIRKVIEGVETSAGPGSLATSVAKACDLVKGVEHAAVVVISDGSEPFAPCEAASMETLWVGSPQPNVGITAFAIARHPKDPARGEGFVEVMNASTSRAAVELRLDHDGRLLRVSTLEVAPGDRVRRVFEGIALDGQEQFAARLSKITFADRSADALGLDDVAYASPPAQRAVAVNLVGESRPLQLALRADGRYSVVSRASAAEGNDGAVTIVVGPVREKLPPGRYLLINPEGVGAPFNQGPTVASPPVTTWRESHPVLRGVVVSDLFVAAATRTTLPASATVLIASPETPLAYAVADGPMRIVGTTFDLGASNFPLRVGFPVFVYNALAWLAQSTPATEPDPARTGIRSNTPVAVKRPDGVTHTVEPVAGRVGVRPGPPGFYELTAPNGKRLATLAVSVADRGETSVSPLAEGGAAAVRATASAGGRFQDRELSTALLMFAFALMLIEWATYHRGLTV